MEKYEKENQNQENQPTPKEEFNPSERLKLILKAPSKKRRELYEAFKQELTTHKEKIAKISQKMIEIVEEEERGGNYHTPEELYNIFLHLSQLSSLNPSLMEQLLARQLIQNYTKRRDYLRYLCQQNPDKNRLFEKLFGFSPKGKIELIKTSWSLYFRLYDQSDYFSAIKNENGPNSSSTKQGKNEIDEAIKQSGGITPTFRCWPPILRGAIILENSASIFSPDENEPNQKLAEEVFRHEQTHSLINLFNLDLTESQKFERTPLLSEIMESIAAAFSTTKKTSEEDFQKIERLLEKYLKAVRELAESWAKEEILAYFNDGGRSLITIQEGLLRKRNEGGGYDYLFNEREFLLKWSALIRKKIEEVFNDKIKEVGLEEKELNRQKIIVEEFIRRLNQIISESLEQMQQSYEQTIKSAISTLGKLQKAGYNKSQIINLLLYEPLNHWTKTAKRITEKTNKNEENEVSLT